MKLLDLTLETAQQNLACDEALLDEAEAGSCEEILRFWEPKDYFVVLGYSNKIFSEVNVNSCRENDIPILRRVSGGGTVLQGPGCLNYTLILRMEAHPQTQSITATNQYIMHRHAEALRSHGAQIESRGTSDLALNSLKFSGNAQRRKRRYLMYHGTFLVDFELEKIETFLMHPSREPDYRHGRSHRQFVTNLPLARPILKRALAEAWNALESPAIAPIKRINSLIKERYGQADWNNRF